MVCTGAGHGAHLFGTPGILVDCKLATTKKGRLAPPLVPHPVQYTDFPPASLICCFQADWIIDTTEGGIGT